MVVLLSNYEIEKYNFIDTKPYDIAENLQRIKSDISIGQLLVIVPALRAMLKQSIMMASVDTWLQENDHTIMVKIGEETIFAIFVLFITICRWSSLWYTG